MAAYGQKICERETGVRRTFHREFGSTVIGQQQLKLRTALTEVIDSGVTLQRLLKMEVNEFATLRPTLVTAKNTLKLEEVLMIVVNIVVFVLFIKLTLDEVGTIV